MVIIMATFILLVSFTVLFILKRFYMNITYQKIGRFSMSAMLIFIGISHFFIPSNLAAMVPPFIPFPITIVYLTGVVELLFAITLLFEKTYKS